MYYARVSVCVCVCCGPALCTHIRCRAAEITAIVRSLFPCPFKPLKNLAATIDNNSDSRTGSKWQKERRSKRERQREREGSEMLCLKQPAATTCPHKCCHDHFSGKNSGPPLPHAVDPISFHLSRSQSSRRTAEAASVAVPSVTQPNASIWPDRMISRQMKDLRLPRASTFRFLEFFKPN